MTDHFQNIYAHHAGGYEALIAREDYKGNILAALQDIRPLAGLEVVEFGAGTGRLTRLLAPLVKRIRAFDASAHMLAEAEMQMQKTGLTNWTLAVGENYTLPVEAGSADIAIQGWSFGHCCGWYPDSWKDEIGKAIAEMKRVTHPGGTLIMLETQGTGRETPAPPNDSLAAYYAWVEKELGFSSAWIRTDYRFESLAEAERLTRFFFGDELADEVVRREWVILPECTGIWWLTL
ncbi:MAG: class I SAM-dependent methyltransferase [Anaerolineae bacterium]|nr:class I SAM-dependent methyltransferase [Anaerolineae bacterium]